jgi:hypothetical protein
MSHYGDIIELQEKIRELEAENAELRKRPRLFVLDRIGPPLHLARGSKNVSHLLRAADKYHLRLETDDASVWEFTTMLCTRTPNCFVQTAEVRTADGDSELIPTEIIATEVLF